MRDPYSVLGVSQNASDDEVKRLTGNWPENITPTTIRTTPWPTWPRRR